MSRNDINTLLKSKRLSGEEAGLLFIDNAIEFMQTGKELFSELDKDKIINCLGNTKENKQVFSNIVGSGGIINQLLKLISHMGIEFLEASRNYLIISSGLIEHRMRYKTDKFCMELNCKKKLTNKDLETLRSFMNATEEIPASTYSKLIRQPQYLSETYKSAMKHYANASILYITLTLFADKFNKKRISLFADTVKIRTDFDVHLIGWVIEDMYDDAYNDITLSNKQQDSITEKLDEISNYTISKVIDKSLMPNENNISKAKKFVENITLGHINLFHITKILEEG